MTDLLRTFVIFICCAARIGLVSAQYNDKGRLHLAIGATVAAHGTEYEQTLRFLGIPFQTRSTGAAATYTMPIEFQYGIVKGVSLGLYAEPGRYVDSVASRTNTIAMFGLQPRFYMVNKDRFAWMSSLYLGATWLRIDDVEGVGSPKSTYGGAHFGLSSGVGFLFTEVFGVQVHLRYLANRLPLREYELDGQSLSLDAVDAELRAWGLGLQTTLHVRF